MVRWILATVAIFVVWQVMDFVIHGVILMPTYEATAALWRPQGEMKYGLMAVVTAITAVAFTSLYCLLVARKGVKTGVVYGLLYGIATGVGMGYGTYSVQPIPYTLALAWFLATVVEATVGGAIVGALCCHGCAGKSPGDEPVSE